MYFWLVINVANYLVFSLQTDVIWSSVFICGLDWHSKNSCWETAKEIVWLTTWGHNVKKLQTVDETVTLAIMGCEKNMLFHVWEQWEKLIFYFPHDLLKKVIQNFPQTPSCLRLWNGTIKNLFQSCIFLKNIPNSKNNLFSDLIIILLILISTWSLATKFCLLASY